jgi:hypothetical protein
LNHKTPSVSSRKGKNMSIYFIPIATVGVAFLSMVLALGFGKRVDPSNDEDKKQRIGTRNWLTIISFVWGICLLLSPGLMCASIGYAPPGSAEAQNMSLGFSIALSFPLVFLCSIGGSWILFKVKKDFVARIFSLLPLVNVIVFLVFLFWVEYGNY